MTGIIIATAFVLVANTLGNIALARLLLKQARLLCQATATINAAMHCVAELAEQLANLRSGRIPPNPN